MRNVLNLFAIFLMVIISGCRFAEVESEDNLKTEVVSLFTVERLSWRNSNNVENRQSARFTPAGKNDIAVFSFLGTPNKRESQAIAFKPISLKKYESILFEYKATRGTLFTVDLWWDGGPQIRSIRSAAGDGTWKIVEIPVRGDKLKIALGMVGLKTGKEQIRKVWLRQPKGVLSHDKQINMNMVDIKTPIIIPEPKQCVRSLKIFDMLTNGKVNFTFCFRNDITGVKKIIVNEMAEKIGLLKNEIPVTQALDGVPDKHLVIILNDIGASDGLGDGGIPAKKEGYAIKLTRKGEISVLTLAGHDTTGLYWAWQTLKQMLVYKNGKWSLNACDIRDWPDFPYRAFVCYNIKGMKKNYTIKANFNQVPWWVGGINNRWRNPTQGYFDNIREMARFAVARGMSINQWIQPFQNNQNKTISSSIDSDIADYVKLFNVSLEQGSRGVVLGIDDGGRFDKSFSVADRKAYDKDKLLSHAWFVKKASDKIFENYPDAIVSVVTSHYENAKGIWGYYDRIGVSKNVIINWTGEQCVTFDYPKKIVSKYEKGIEGRRFVIFDNTPGQDHGMYRGLIFCEEYATGYKELAKSEKLLGCFAMASYGKNALADIKALTISDFMWNGRTNYNPKRSLQLAIAKVAKSKEAVVPILKFAARWLKIAYKYPVDKALSQKEKIKPLRHVLEKREVSRYNIDSKQYAILQKQFSELDSLFADVKEKCKNSNLTKLIGFYLDNSRKIIAYLHKNYRKPPLIPPYGEFEFVLDHFPGGTWYKTYAYNCPPKKCIVIYGKQTPYHTISTSFLMREIPSGDAKFTLEGQNCDKNVCDIELKLNGHLIFSGKTPFAKNAWKQKQFVIPSSFFKKGKNIITIRNLDDNSDFIDHWAMFSRFLLKFDKKIRGKLNEN